jgi:hypothetical protein
VEEGNFAYSKLFKLRSLGSIENENRAWIEVKEKTDALQFVNNIMVSLNENYVKIQKPLISIF